MSSVANIAGQIRALGRFLAEVPAPHTVAEHWGGEYCAPLETLRVPFRVEGFRVELSIRPATPEGCEARAKKWERQARYKPGGPVFRCKRDWENTKRAKFSWRVARAFIKDDELDNLRNYFELYDYAPVVTCRPDGSAGEVMENPKFHTVRGLRFAVGRLWDGKGWRWATCEPHTGNRVLGGEAHGAAWTLAAARKALEASKPEKFDAVMATIAAAEKAGKAEARYRELFKL